MGIKKIDKIIEKHTLYRIRQIIVNEYKKDYYENISNIRELVPIITKNKVDKNNRKYQHIENLKIYRNGFVIFQKFNLSIPAFISDSNFGRCYQYKYRYPRKYKKN